MTELEIQTQMKEAAALERIATALEQLVLEFIEARLKAPQAPQMPVAAMPFRPPAPAPQSPEPPPVGVYDTKPPAGPVNGGPQPFATPVFIEGSVHATGHKPLKVNKRGLYCPTKLADDSWCPWRVSP